MLVESLYDMAMFAIEQAALSGAVNLSLATLRVSGISARMGNAFNNATARFGKSAQTQLDDAALMARFASPDKHVPEAATAIQKAFPESNVMVNVHLPARVAGLSREVDIVTDLFIVQVKRDAAKGLGGQIEQTAATLINNRRTVIGFAPDHMPDGAWEAAARSGIAIARNLDELIVIMMETRKF